MEDPILVVNCGSSSLKLALFSPQGERVVSVLAERLNSPSAVARVSGEDDPIPIPGDGNYAITLETIIEHLQQRRLLKSAPLAIGHRVVHGGESFKEPALITPEVRAAIQKCAPLAPLHNPVNLLGIEAAQRLFPDVPQVAVFDTAYHQSLPEHAFRYALPGRFYDDWAVRRYGFHGTSHQFMASEAARLLDQALDDTSIISAHLGNGCSITAIHQGKSVDTSMGLTPLEGLVMGTRSGDIDPGLFDFLAAKGIDAEEVTRILNKESGLLGLSGETNDMRTLSELASEGHSTAHLAIEVFCFRLARYIGSMMASLPKLDALVFTGGIGENSALVRQKTIAHLDLLGFSIEASHNLHHGKDNELRIQSDRSRFPIMVIPTNEERVIAESALAHSQR